MSIQARLAWAGHTLLEMSKLGRPHLKRLTSQRLALTLLDRQNYGKGNSQRWPTIRQQLKNHEPNQYCFLVRFPKTLFSRVQREFGTLGISANMDTSGGSHPTLETNKQVLFSKIPPPQDCHVLQLNLSNPHW